MAPAPAISWSTLRSRQRVLTKSGGRLELGAVNTYVGVTRINTGDVQVDTGAVIGAVNLAGGSISGKGNVGTISMLSTGVVNPGYNGTASPRASWAARMLPGTPTDVLRRFAELHRPGARSLARTTIAQRTGA